MRTARSDIIIHQKQSDKRLFLPLAGTSPHHLVWSLDHGDVVDPGPCRAEGSFFGVVFLEFFLNFCHAQEDKAEVAS